VREPGNGCIAPHSFQVENPKVKLQCTRIANKIQLKRVMGYIEIISNYLESSG
jgi:hypothetical protein